MNEDDTIEIRDFVLLEPTRFQIDPEDIGLILQKTKNWYTVLVNEHIENIHMTDIVEFLVEECQGFICRSYGSNIFLVLGENEINKDAVCYLTSTGDKISFYKWREIKIIQKFNQ